jgi:hypothetical protein
MVDMLLSTTPSWLLFILIVGGSVVLASVATLHVRRRMKTPVDETHNEVAGLGFAAVSAVYAVLLAFVVVVVGEQFNTAKQNASLEGTDIIAVARTSTSFPEPARRQVHDLLVKYSHIVISEELAQAKQGELLQDGSPDALAVLNQIWTIYRGVPPTAVDSDMTATLNELSKDRDLRLLHAQASLPNIFWTILVFGAVITIFSGLILHMKNTRLHVVTIALLTATIVLCLWLIIELNRPFTGDLSVSPDPYQHAIYVINSLPR